MNRDFSHALNRLAGGLCLLLFIASHGFGAEDPVGPQRGKRANVEPPVPLESTRIDMRIDLLHASLDPLKAYILNLDELAKTLASSRDYEGAMAARAERRLMQSELDRIAKEITLLNQRQQFAKTEVTDLRFVLPLNEARLEGPVFDPKTKRITGWQRGGAQAEWTLPDLPPGGYEILLTFECDALEGGNLIVSEEFYTLSATLDTTLRGPETQNLGTLKITNGSGPFRLTARTVVRDNLMNLSAVELLPANR